MACGHIRNVPPGLVGHSFLYSSFSSQRTPAEVLALSLPKRKRMRRRVVRAGKGPAWNLGLPRFHAVPLSNRACPCLAEPVST